MGSYYRQQLEDWLKNLDVDADVVYDIGGAQGEVKDRVKSWKVKVYKVLDLPEYDLDEMFDPWHKYHEHADLVFCLEVFEYLINPVFALNKINRVLKKGGRAYITFQFIYPHHNELDRDSLRYTETGVRRLAKFNNLDITNIWYRIDKSGLLQDFYSADGMRRAKQYNHHDATGFIVEFKKP